MQLHHRGLIALLFLLLFFPGVSNSESLVEGALPILTTLMYQWEIVCSDASASLDNEKGSCPHDSSSVSESDGVCTATQKPKTKTHYIRAAITNSADNRIRQHLDELELLITPVCSSLGNILTLTTAGKFVFQEKVEKCIDGFDKLLSKYPNRYGIDRSWLHVREQSLHLFNFSPRGRYGKARCLDVQSEKESSNKLLEKAIEVYQQVWDLLKLSAWRFHIASDCRL